MRTVLLITLLAIQAMGSDQAKTWDDWLAAGNRARDAGDYSAAIQAFQCAVALAKTAGVEDRQRIPIYDSLASTYADAGQYAESVAQYRRELALAEKITGRHSVTYALILGSLSTLPLEFGGREEAIAILRATIAENRSTAAPRDLAVVRNQLVLLLRPQKGYAEMEHLLLDVVNDFNGQKGVDPMVASAAFNGLGVVRFDRRPF